MLIVPEKFCPPGPPTKVLKAVPPLSSGTSLLPPPPVPSLKTALFILSSIDKTLPNPEVAIARLDPIKNPSFSISPPVDT